VIIGAYAIIRMFTMNTESHESTARKSNHGFCRISSTATTVLGHQISQQVARQFCRALFQETYPDIDRLLPVFSNAMVENRYFSVPEDRTMIFLAISIFGPYALLFFLDGAGEIILGQAPSRLRRILWV
jgi:hypothetical protein